MKPLNGAISWFFKENRGKSRPTCPLYYFPTGRGCRSQRAVPDNLAKDRTVAAFAGGGISNSPTE